MARCSPLVFNASRGSDRSGNPFCAAIRSLPIWASLAAQKDWNVERGCRNNNGQLTINNLQFTMDDGRWTMNDEQFTMNDGRWTMNNERFTMDDGR
ncbi:MAG: hypothetical protein U0T73_02080 [Chitinophagales bacterium]